MSAATAIRAATNRLKGAWRSDRGRSIAQWKFSKPVTAKRRREFSKMFGKNVWRFGPNTCTGEFEDLRWTARYKVLWADDHSAIVRFRDEEGTRCNHFFEDNYFYVAAGYPEVSSISEECRLTTRSRTDAPASGAPLNANVRLQGSCGNHSFSGRWQRC
jgi:hypothetical protein